MTLRKQIEKKFLSNKPIDYEIQENESELITIMEDVIKGLQSDLKYSKDESKRLLNEKLNLEELVEELNEQIKKLEDKIDELDDEY